MLPLIPLLVSTVAGAVGWKLGSLVGTWTAAVLSLVGGTLGYYFGVKIRKSVTP